MNLKPINVNDIRAMRDALSSFLDEIEPVEMDHAKISRLVTWPSSTIAAPGAMYRHPQIREKSEPDGFEFFVHAPGRRYLIVDYVKPWKRWVLWNEEASGRRRCEVHLDDFLKTADPWKDVAAKATTREEIRAELEQHPLVRKNIGDLIGEYVWARAAHGLREILLLKSVEKYLAGRGNYSRGCLIPLRPASSAYYEKAEVYPLRGVPIQARAS